VTVSAARAPGAAGATTCARTVCSDGPPPETSAPKAIPSARMPAAANAAGTGRRAKSGRRHHGWSRGLRLRSAGAAAAPASSAGAGSRATTSASGPEHLRLGADRRHDPVLELGWRGDLHGRERERVGDHLQLGDLAPADLTGLEVRREAPLLVLRQRAEDPGARVVGVLAAHANASASPLSSPRIFFSPRRMRPFTVPIGVSSIAAISLWLKPPK